MAVMRVRRSGWSALLVVALSSTVLVAAPPATRPVAAQAARLTVAPFYEVQRVDSPNPTASGQFGGNLQNAGDIDGDGADDILAPEQGESGHGIVRVVSGATGEVIYTVEYPDLQVGRPGNFGGMVTRVHDLGSCQGGEPGQVCAAETVGAQDGVPEFAVGAWNGAIEGAEDIGTAYVYDGATGALLKRLLLPPEDIALQIPIPKPQRPFSFGRSITSPYSDYPADAPEAVKIGDMTGGGLADIVVGDSSFYEPGPETNPRCNPGPCNGAGRVYFFAGEDIAGSDPRQVLDQPYMVVKNPDPLTDTPFYQGFSHNIIPAGDIGGCKVPPDADGFCPRAEKTGDPQGYPSVAVPHIRASYGEPLRQDAGRAWLVDGRNGAILQRYDPPNPQTGDLWSYNQAHGPAVGDLTGSTHPDIVISGISQDVQFANQGRAFVFNGNPTSQLGGVVLALLDDPQPKQAGYFGGPVAPIGDVYGDPRNEVMIGNSLHFGTEPNVGAVHIFSPATAEVVLTVRDPDEQAGTAFGAGLAVLGDLNDDGYVDFAAGNNRFDGEQLQQGRLYIFRSGEEPGPEPEPEPTEEALRLAGDDRMATAVAVSAARFETETVRAAVVARADDPADALAAGPLAVAVDGPVLLTPGGALHPATAAELRRILLPDAVVYIPGGTRAISQAVERSIRDLGYATRRVHGPTRIETAIAIARSLGNREQLLITNGYDFPDALTAAAAAASIEGSVLLTTPDRPHASLDAYLAERPSAQLYAVGGPAARAYPRATAVLGPTRDHTAVAVARRFFTGPEAVGVARRDSFPDALTGGAHIGALGGPMLLTATAGLHQVTSAYLCESAASITTAFVYGGLAGVSDGALQQIADRIRGSGC